jgi:hypothetical protein
MAGSQGQNREPSPRTRDRGRLAAWLLPEWHPWFRDWSDVIRLSFLLAVAPLLVFDRPEALRLFLTFLVSLLPRLTATPAAFDLGFNLAFSLQAWGNVTQVFELWLPYHDIVHFSLTGATAALVYFVLQRMRLLPDLAEEQSIHQQLGICVVIVAMGTTINAIYEEYEYFAINFLHMQLTEYYQHDINDLFFGFAGSLLTGLLLVLWSRRSWPTRRPARGDPLPGLLRGFERRMERSVSAQTRGRAVAAGRRSPGAHLDRGPHAPASPHLPRLLAGDWTSVVRDVQDLVRLSFLVGAALAASQAQWELAVRFGLTFVAAVAVRAIEAPRLFDLLFGVAMAFQAWGSYAGAYTHVPAYARWTDFDVAVAFAVLSYLVLVRFRVLPEFADEPGVHRRVAIFLVAMCLGMSAGVFYELYMWLANHALGGEFRVGWTGLTIGLALDWAGGCAAGLAIVVWDVYGWGTRRRLPAGRVAQRRPPGLAARSHSPSAR